MDDNVKHTPSYQLDQEILDARGIEMTVEEVAGLPTAKYSERVQALHLSEDDLNFLKGLRRRIKNRLASQNSRRRSMEQLRRLTRELRAVRACRDDALAERESLLLRRDLIRDQCYRLRDYLLKSLHERKDSSVVPSIDVERVTFTESQTPKEETKKITEGPTASEMECLKNQNVDRSVLEYRLDKLVQQSVNHLYRNDRKTICAKTVYITNDTAISDVKTMFVHQTLSDELKDMFKEDELGVLNLSLKEEGRRRNHGRKQSAPRRIPYVCYNEDDVLDLKIKKESQ